MKATEQYFPVVLFIMLYKVILTFESGWNPKVWPFKWKLLSSTFLWCCLLCCRRLFYHLSLGKILKNDHSNESYLLKYFLVALFILLYNWTGSDCYGWEVHSLVLFIMAYKVVLAVKLITVFITNSTLVVAFFITNFKYYGMVKIGIVVERMFIYVKYL